MTKPATQGIEPQEAANPADLTREICASIDRNGPMPVEAYMALCLYGESGYYRCRPAIGANGDFTTAPEISQVFGEMIGLWCVLAWRQMGAPGRIRIVEYGPGRGTLMADLLRALRVAPEFAAVVQVELIEISEALQAVQRVTLARSGFPVSWTQGLHPTPFDGATLVIGNEFLDAFPVSQAVWRDGQWLRRCVGPGADGQLVFVAGDPVPASELAGSRPGASVPADGAADGDVIEWRRWSGPDTQNGLADQLASIASQGPLAALFIDYGHDSGGHAGGIGGLQVGDTLQAVRNHRYDHPLAHPGRADLTAHVDFAGFLADCRACGLATQAAIPQGPFLASLGAVERAQRLMQGAQARQANAIETGVQRLLAPQGMGGRFLVAAVLSPGMAELPGLGPDMGR